MNKNHQSPFFSIIIPSFNRARYLSAAINSILNQEFNDWECIVVDDGSTDNTQEVISSFTDSRVRYYYKQNEERSIARNFGIKNAVGQYICFLDSDDEYYPYHLKTLYDTIINKDFPVAMFYTGIVENRDGKLVYRDFYDEKKFKNPIFYIWENFLLINSVCLHRNILEEHKFPEKFNVWEDTHLWLRIAAQYSFYQIPENTTVWNIHDKASVSRAFSMVNTQHVKNYLNCISHLFETHGDLLKPFLTEKNKKEYKLRKLKMFLCITFNTADYKTFLELYFLGLKHVDKKILSKLVFRKVFKRLRRRIIRD